MRVVLLTVAALATAVLLTGCGAKHSRRTTSTAAAPNLQALPPSKTEREWLRILGLTQSSPVATGARADEVAASILKVAWVPGVQVVSLNVYSIPKRASALASALVVAVARPAYFLRHQLKPILTKLSGKRIGAHYVLVVDEKAKRVLESFGASFGSHSEGSLYVRPGLYSCSPIVTLSPPPNPPPCPSK